MLLDFHLPVLSCCYDFPVFARLLLLWCQMHLFSRQLTWPGQLGAALGVSISHFSGGAEGCNLPALPLCVSGYLCLGGTWVAICSPGQI